MAHSALSKDVAGVATASAFLKAVDEGVKYFNTHGDEAVEYIATNLDYSEADAREWLKTVEFSKDCRAVDRNDIEKTVDILRKAGVVKDDTVKVADMILDLH